MAKYSYIYWSYGILHKQVCKMIATIYSRLSYGGLVASKTKHLGQYCVRLSCGYSQGTKVISKQNIKAKIALPSWIFMKTGEE